MTLDVILLLCRQCYAYCDQTAEASIKQYIYYLNCPMRCK